MSWRCWVRVPPGRAGRKASFGYRGRSVAVRTVALGATGAVQLRRLLPLKFFTKQKGVIIMSIRFYENPEKKQVIAIAILKDGSTVRAKATCASGDEYNYDYGKRLAGARLKARLAERDYITSLKEYDKALAEYGAMIIKLNKLSNVVEHNQRYFGDKYFELAEVINEIS